MRLSTVEVFLPRQIESDTCYGRGLTTSYDIEPLPQSREKNVWRWGQDF